MKINKIFGIGFHKTGTTSLGIALEKLGYKCCPGFGIKNPKIEKKLLKIAFKKVEIYDAFQDNPWPIIYTELDKKFPNSKFILTIRPTERWIKSVVNHFGEKKTQMRKLIYGKPSVVGNEELYISRYERHNREVREYFKDRPEDLLILDITSGEGWEKLCPFLGKKVRLSKFPHANKRLDSKSKDKIDLTIANNLKSQSKNSVELISIHVPKTAGTAFTRLLLRVYGPEGVFLDYPYEKDYQRQFMKEGEPKVKVIHGHFPGAKYQNKFPDAKRIIWLREPVKFLISYYCFNKVFKRTMFYDLLQKKNLSFLEFAEIPENQNLMSLYLRDMKLEDFFFVGIQEFFEEDLKRLKKLLSWPEVKISKENNNLYSDYKTLRKEVLSDRALVDKVASLNSKDVEIYQEGLKMR